MYPGIQDIDMITSTLTTYDPFYAAAQVAGMLASSGITQALTRQNVACKGLEGTLQTSLQSSDYDTLTNAGVLAIRSEQTQTGGTIFYVVRSVTTWLQDTKLPNVEISMVCNEDYVSIIISNAINAYLVGKAGSPVGVGQVTSVIDSGLRSCVDDGSIVGDSNMPAFSNIVVSLTNGIVQSSYLATIPAPMNFFGVTSAFQLYSKTA